MNANAPQSSFENHLPRRVSHGRELSALFAAFAFCKRHGLTSPGHGLEQRGEESKSPSGMRKAPTGGERGMFARLLLCFAAWIGLMPGLLIAGNGPQNWLVVYDPGDPHGVAIARHYQQARGFPDRNLVAYSFPRRAAGSPSLKHQITATECWTFIGSLRATITARGLDGQIHGITLVGNAPNSVKTTTPDSTASISSALFFAPGTTTQAEWEARTDDDTQIYRGTTGVFAGVTAGLPATEIRSDISFGGQRYWLSTHLGFTGLQGVRPDEVFALIDRSSGADGTAPKGTIYWPLNSDDLRSGTREPQAAYLEPEWKSLGLDYHIYGQSYGGGNYAAPQNKTGAPGSFPHTNRAVQGAICGVQFFELDSQPSIYTPGAIAEHLTSFGGVMGGGMTFNQSTCVMWLRAGASGTSGTVVEPFATARKFPNARIHSHYFNGATLAEAFSMSLQQPWQTLVMGDGLTQPYAKIPAVTLSGIAEGAVVSGTVTLGAVATGAAGVESNLDLVIDGRKVNIGGVGEPVAATRVSGGFQINTTTLSEGWHELRVVGYAANGVRSQGFATRSVTVNNSGGSVALTAPANAVFGGNFSVTATPSGLSGVTSIEIRSLGQVLATLGAAGGTASIPANKLSYYSPSRLVAVAKLGTSAEVSSSPQSVAGVWTPLPAQAEAPTIPGAVAVARIFAGPITSSFNWDTATPSAVVPITDRYNIAVESADQWPFLKDPLPKGGGIEFITRFFARETGVYDFVLEGFVSSMGLSVDGTHLVPGVSTGSPNMPSVPLAMGWHDIRLRVTVPSITNANLWQFMPAFRSRYTKRFMGAYGWPVKEFEPFSMAHCAAPVLATGVPQLAARATGAGSAQLVWTDPFPSETGWKVERFIGDPGVTLLQYSGTNTPPVLLDRNHADALAPKARVANDSTELFTTVPPYLQGGSRLLTASADRQAAETALIYRVQVPAGTTVYTVVERGKSTMPTWMTTQGGWTAVTAVVKTAKGVDVESQTRSSWSVYRKTITVNSTLDLGGAGPTINDVNFPTFPRQAITFVFLKTGAAWEEIGNATTNATTTTVSGLAAGTHRLRVSAVVPPSAIIPTNEVVMDLTAAAANGTPSVSAGPDLQVTSLSVPLRGSAIDDGLPGALTTSWSKLSGPGTVTFENAATPSTSATFSATGIYTLQFLATDGNLSATDTVTVTVTGDSAANQAPVVNAGTNQSILESQSVTLSGTATDDGLPSPPATLNYLWRQTGGPALMSFDNAEKPDAKVFFPVPGTYTLELKVSDGLKSGSDTVDFTVAANPNNAPVVSIASTANAVTGVPITLSASITDDGLPNPPRSLTTAWSKLLGPYQKTVAFSAPNARVTTATFPDVGDYVLRVNASDGERTSGQSIAVTVAYNPASNQPPTLSLPTAAETLLGDTVEVNFSVSDDGKPNPPAAVTTSWEKVSGPGAAVGETYGAQVSNNLNGALSFDQPGIYVMRLTANDGVATTSKTITVTVRDVRHRQVWGWGRNTTGQIGPFEYGLPLSRPYLIGRGWSDADVSSETTFAIGRQGSVLGAGRNDSGVLDRTDATYQRYFSPLHDLKNVRSVAFSDNTPTGAVAVVKADGKVWTWGNSIGGQLGDGSAGTRLVPGEVPGLSGVATVCGKASTFLAVTESGQVFGWGHNSYAQLGVGDKASRLTPTLIAVSGVRQTALGGLHSLFLKTDGTVWAAGANFDGALGDGTVTERLVQVLKGPSPGTPLTGIQKVAAGYRFSLGVDALGQVWAWGDNFNGTLGNGNNTDSRLATRVIDPVDPSGFLTGVIDIACGIYTAYAVKSDGSIVAWGSSLYNAFGAGQSTANRTVPGPVGGLPPVSSVWAANNSVFAATPWATYKDFVAEHFTTQEIAAGKAAPSYDYLGGGRPNLLVYATGGDPKAVGSAPLAWTRFEGGQFVFETEYLAAASDLALQIESSSNLSIWNAATPATVEELDLGDMTRQTLRFNLDPGQTRFFLRLRAQQLTAP